MTTKRDWVSLGALALVSAVALALEVFLSRIVLYTLAPILVYFVIGIAMLGFGAASSYLAWRSAREPARDDATELARWAAAFPLTLIASYALFVRLAPTVPAAITLGSFATALLLTLPFVAAGGVITICLAAARERVRTVYAANLCGSGLGCFLPIALLGPIDGERLLGALALAGSVAALLFLSRTRDRLARSLCWTALGASAVAVVFAPALFRLTPEPTGQVAVIRDFGNRAGFRMHRAYDRWNATGRVEIFEFSAPSVPRGDYPYRFFAQDNSTGALLVGWDGRPKAAVSAEERTDLPIARACERSPYGFGHFAPRDRVLVVGVGGGLDVQCALYHGAERVDAVEINPDAISALTGPFRETTAIGRDPRVAFHVRDGRSFVRGAAPGSYDLVQLTGVDTKSVLAAGSMALAENHLYTVEAVGDYLRVLREGGALVMIRFTEVEALRMLATAVEALSRLGEPDPESSVAVVRQGLAYALIARRGAFSSESLEELRHYFAFGAAPFEGLEVVFLAPFGFHFEEPPVIESLPPVGGETSFDRYLAAHERGADAAFVDALPLNVEPATDDRPFFFDVVRYDRPGVLGWPHLHALAVTLGSVLVLAVAGILWPSFVARGRSGFPRSAPWAAAALGLSYLLVEVWLVHRFSMYLGHQTYGLGVVIAVLLIATGLGAALGGRGLGTARRATIGILGTIAWLALLAGALPWVLGATWSARDAIRVAVAVVAIAPAGFCMGFPFPALLGRVARESEGAVAWCVGINSFLSVFATVLAIPMALGFGYSSILACGLVGYGLALLAMRPLGK